MMKEECKKSVKGLSGVLGGEMSVRGPDHHLGPDCSDDTIVRGNDGELKFTVDL